MKVICIAIVALGLSCFRLASTQECQEGSGAVCPRNFPVQSDASTGICESPGAATIRSRIQQEVTDAVSDQLSNALKPKYIGLNSNFPAENCAEIRRYRPGAPSGLYFLHDSVRGYCNFDFQTPSGTDEFGWERLTFLNLTDSSTPCPGAEFRAVENGGTRYCVRTNTLRGCTSAYFSSPIPVNRVYGRVIGILIGTGDIISDRLIDDIYLDGVSLTYGNPGNRRHIWSFMAYTSEAFNQCPCSINASTTTPDFVGDNYFCESGTQLSENFDPEMAYTDDPLWDGLQCGLTEEPCCMGDMPPPWFYREFDLAFEDPIELRICVDQGVDDENVGLQLVELWVQ